MSYKKLLQDFTAKELAEALVFPAKLSKKQQMASDMQLAEARRKSLEGMTEKERLTGSLMGLKYRMEEHFRSNFPNSEYSFSYFLKLYIEILGRKRREFSAEIGVDETLLSQLINQHRTPPDYFPIRLELHSNNSVPAEYWFRIIEKDREEVFMRNKASMKKKERRFVKGGISVRL